jgi:hypothetical protein
LDFVTQRLDQPRIPGLDIVVATHGSEPTNDFRAGDVVIARRNNTKAGILNGDLGLVVEQDGRFAVEAGPDHTIPLSNEFGRVGMLSYHRTQGLKFRSVLAIADRAEDERHFGVILAATSNLTIVGEADHIARMVGPLDLDGKPDLAEVQRRAGRGVRLEVNFERYPT